jgi:hypothetical protein
MSCLPLLLGITVSSVVLSEKVTQSCEQLHPEEPEKLFKASKGWVWRSMQLTKKKATAYVILRWHCS